MLKTSTVCSEGSYSFQLLCFNKYTWVIKLYGHKIYCKLKIYESRHKHRAKIFTEELFISSFNSIILFNFISFNSYKNSRKMPIEKFTFEVRNLQFYKNWTLWKIILYYSYYAGIPAKYRFFLSFKYVPTIILEFWEFYFL